MVDACTLCDMYFMTKCPYVQPHSFDLDFPHLMLRHRAVEHRKGNTSLADTELAKMDRNGKLGSVVSRLANWAIQTGNGLTRPVIEAVAGIDRRAHLPPFMETPLFFEVADPVRRDIFLRTIGGVEEHIAVRIGSHIIRARPEGDLERTRASDNKTSAVHFMHFDFTAEAIAAWKSGQGSAMLGIDHPNYGHAALIGGETRAFLARECFQG